MIKCLEASIAIDGPVYLRLTGTINQPIVHKTDIIFIPGVAYNLLEGEDIAIFTTGSMVAISLKAAQILSNEGISTAVIDEHTISPFDTESVLKHLDKYLIVTVEEHSVKGGLGSSIAEVLTNSGNSPPLLRIGIEKYYHAGDYNYMLETADLTAEKIINRIKTKLKETKNDFS